MAGRMGWTAGAAAMLLLAGIDTALGQSPLGGALGETKPTIDYRMRYEHVEQLGFAEEADALSWRIRLGAQTGRAWNTALLAEFEAVDSLSGHYRADNSVPGVDIAYPVVADPDGFEINRLHLTNTSLPGTTITLGRQRINLDDQRFVGNVGWRQNEQGFDALRVVNVTVPNLTLDFT
jgi:hypothetical protein